MTSRIWLLVIGLAVCLIVVLAYLFLLMDEPKPSCSERVPPPVVVAFGDSLIEGYGATTKGGFVSLVSSVVGLPIRNFGKSGDTTESAERRVAEVLNEKPNIVIVLLGGNDALKRVPIETSRANLDNVLASFKRSGAQIVLLGVVGGLPFKDPYPAMYEELAERYDAVYVSNVLSGLIGRQEFMSDPIHPNEAGYARIAERVLPALEEACGKLK